MWSRRGLGLCLWALLIAAVHFGWPCSVALAEGVDAIGSLSPRIVTLASDPISDLTLLIGPDDVPLAAWLTTDADGTPQLALAMGPDGEIQRYSLGTLGTTELIEGSWDEQPVLWWVQRDGQQAWTAAWDGAAGDLLPAQAIPTGAVPARPASGLPEVLVWPAEGGLWAMDASGDERLVLSGVEDATDLVAVRHDVGLLLAWRGPDGAIYLYDESRAEPLQLSPAGQRPQLVCGGQACHCFWLQDGQVWGATAPNWDAPEVTGAVPASEAGWALDVDAMGYTHLIWVEDGLLWHSFGGDWAASRHRLDNSTGADAMALALDSRGALHLLWAEPSEDGVSALRYLEWDPRLPQARLVGPTEGERVRGSVTVYLETNLSRSQVEQVRFFLEAEPAADGEVSGALLALDATWSDEDGWSTLLDGAVYGAPYLQRVVAQMRCADGTTRWVWGDWFALTCEGAPLLWVDDNARVVVYLPVSADLLPDRLDLYLEPQLGEAASTALPPPHPDGLLHISVGSLFPEVGGRHVVDLPLSDLPDGDYVVRLWVETGGARYLLPVAPGVVIRASGLPEVFVQVPAATASAQDELLFEATAKDVDGTVTQVSFHLVPSSETRSQRAIWLGTDIDGSDGWSVRARGGEAGRWRLRAEATDDDGNRNVALSDEVILLTSPAVPAAEFITPHDGSVVRGVKTVRLAVDPEGAALGRSTFMVASEDGGYEILGALVPQVGELRFAWDTSHWPDGVYRLAALLEFAGGRTSLVETKAEVVNHPVALRFDQPRAGDSLRGWQVVRLVPTVTGGEIDAVELYARDTLGELYPLGSAQFQDGAWVATWLTRTLLDGAYDLVAYVDGATLNSAEVRVEVANQVPELRATIAQRDGSLPELTWSVGDADIPRRDALSVALSYSPSDGRTWLPIANQLALSGTMTLETSDLPESRDGLLRIQVMEGARPIAAALRPLTVNNVNETPYLRLLAPQPADILDDSAVVAWESLGVDTAKWRASLAYRHLDGDWVPLADDLDPTGRFLWDLNGLPSRDGYALRLLVSDDAGNEAMAIADDLTFTSNAPPRVRLIAPGAGAVFEGEVGLLWEASDPDGDPLRVTVDYSHDAGMTWLPVAEDVPDRGYLAWYAAYLPPGRSYRVRVTVSDGLRTAQATSGTFGIGPAPAPSLRLVAPAAGERVSGHTVVRWQAESRNAHLLSASVLIRPRGESNWQTLAANMPNDGHFLWDTTGLRDGYYELQVRVTDGTRTAAAELAGSVEIANQGCPDLYLELDQPWPASPWTGLRELAWRLGLPESESLTGTLLLRAPDATDWEVVDTFDPLEGRLLVDARKLAGVAAAELALSVASECDVVQLGLGPVVRLGHYQGSPPIAEMDLLRGHELSPDDHLLAWWAEADGGRPLAVDLWGTADGLAIESILAVAAPRGTYWLTTGEVRALEGVALGLTASDGIFRVRTLATSSTVLLPGHDLLPTVDLLAPLASDTVSGTVSVEWLALTEHPDAQASITVSSDGGLEWRRLATIPASEGSYAWDTTRLPNGQCLLKVGLEQEGWLSSELVVPLFIRNKGRHAPTVALTLPTEDVPWSGPRRITWVSHDADGDDLTMNLAYSVNDGRTWYVIARGLEDTGSYLLDTSVLPNARRVHLRITAFDGVFRTSAVSASPVIVHDPGRPWVALVAPEDQQVCSGVQEIRWRGFDPARRGAMTVRIELSDDRGATWREVASDLDLAGSIVWEPHDLAHGTAVWLRAIVVDGRGTIVALDALPRPVYVPGKPHAYALPLRLP